MIDLYSVKEISLKELKNNYEVHKVNNNLWIDTKDGGSILINLDPEYPKFVSGFSVSFGGGSTESYKLLAELKEKYKMLNEDELQELLNSKNNE